MIQSLMIWRVRCQLLLLDCRSQIQRVLPFIKLQKTFCCNLNCLIVNYHFLSLWSVLLKFGYNRYFPATFLLNNALLPYLFSHLKWSVLNLEMLFPTAHGWKYAPLRSRYRWQVHQLSSNWRSREEKEITPSTHLRLCPLLLSLLTAGKFSSSFSQPAPSFASDSGKSIYPPHLTLWPLKQYLTNHSG